MRERNKRKERKKQEKCGERLCLEIAAAAAAAAATKWLQSCPTLCDPIDWTMQPTRLHRPWDSPGKNIGVGSHFLLQYMKMKSERKFA